MAGSMYGKIPTRVGRAVPVRAHVAPRRPLCRLAAAVFAGTLVLAFTPMAAQANPAGTVYVDCEHGDDGHGGTSAADAVKTLSQGISLANAAIGPQTLRIAAGPCDTGTTVTAITKDLTVIGAGSGAGGTLINASGLEGGKAAFTIGTGFSPSVTVDLSLSALAIRGAGAVATQAGTAVSFISLGNLTVSGVSVTDIPIGISAILGGSARASVAGSSFVAVGASNYADFTPGWPISIDGSAISINAQESAIATVEHNVLSGNGSDYSAGALYVSASANSSITVSNNESADSAYRGIEATAFGGARIALVNNRASGNAYEGIAVSAGDTSSVTLTDNTSSGNTGDGFTVAASGAAQVTLERNTSSGNTGRGLSVGFDGSATGSVEVVNSTLSGNASEQAGIKSDSGSKGTVSVLFTTVTSTGGSGTGLAIDENSRVTIKYSILDGGTGSGLTIGGDGLDDGHVIMDYTLVRTASQDIEDFYSESDRNIFGEDPLLGALQDNGGATRTHLPGEGSPVIDAGPEAFVGAPATDQRGKPRFGSPADLGAVEVEHPKTTDTGSTGDSGSSTPSPTPTPTPTPTDSTPASETPTSGVAVRSTSVEDAGQSDDATGTTEVLGLAETGPREIGLVTLLGLELLLGGIAVTLLATRRARRRHGC